MATSPSVGAFGNSQGKDDDLGDFFEKLDLHEDEFDDVVVEEEAPELLEEIRWIALARVHTPKLFSQTAFYKDMRAAWNCSQQVRFRPIGPNLFVVQVYCLGDWDRIMQQGPWLFSNMAVMIASVRWIYAGRERSNVQHAHMAANSQIARWLLPA
ncbi:hypothetical protein D1007_09398 [Hordeum vulgare]|nr:hypothetical protein D1007_09398 [Hordeum vulgare]